MSQEPPEARIAHVPRIPFTYKHSEGTETALDLVFMLYPHWKTNSGPVNVVCFTGGFMNTLLKITKEIPGSPESENEKEAILLRAYGNDTDILIDREMEVETHAMLAERGLATPLLARFNNGLLYKYLPGRPCTTLDLVQEPVWRAIAARLGEWHARLPLPRRNLTRDIKKGQSEQEGGDTSTANHFHQRNIWTVLQEWISALPADTNEERNRNATLRKEYDSLVGSFYQESQAYDSFIHGHCDLVSANVLIPSQTKTAANGTFADGVLKGGVQFIDYEYSVPCPPAFDIANHFSEWAGFERDYNMLPTRATRHAFIEEYLRSFRQYKALPQSMEVEVEGLLTEVDRFRGVPGFFWGIWCLVQGKISSIESDWSSHSRLRMEEFWMWRAEEDGSRAGQGKEKPLRERRWTQEAS
ncbi:ethanolamine kinase [Bisporella sp. PMI_857]|nr:ethanolamine kinase [Bisporella sp. PMI_857]